MSDKIKMAATNVSTHPAPKVKGVRRDTDTSLGWITREYPQLEPWRVLAVEWVKGEIRGFTIG